MKALVSKDGLAGAGFIVIGAVSLIIARNYRLGSASNMGPGFFPVLLSAGLVLVGLVLAAKVLFRGGEEPVDAVGWRALLSVIGGIVVFGFLAERVGLVISVAALVGFSALAGAGLKRIELAALIVGLAAFASLVFIYGLGMPLRMFPI